MEFQGWLQLNIYIEREASFIYSIDINYNFLKGTELAGAQNSY